MKQAKVLNEGELKRLLAVVAQRKQAARDRAAVILRRSCSARSSGVQR